MDLQAVTYWYSRLSYNSARDADRPPRHYTTDLRTRRPTFKNLGLFWSDRWAFPEPQPTACLSLGSTSPANSIRPDGAVTCVPCTVISGSQADSIRLRNRSNVPKSKTGIHHRKLGTCFNLVLEATDLAIEIFRA